MIIQVSIPNTPFDHFDYFLEAAPSVDKLIGCRVKVSFRNVIVVGIILGSSNSSTCLKLKPIIELIDHTPLISADILKLCSWISNYYQTTMGEILLQALPAIFRQGDVVKLTVEKIWHLTASAEDCIAQLSKKSHQQLQIINLFAQHPAGLSSENLRQYELTPSKLKPLMVKNIIARQEKACDEPLQNLETPLTLNSHQQHCLTEILNNLNTFKSFVLQGVTGSGKTEIYLQLIAKVLEQGKNALILVPEIGLTPQLMTRFQQRLPQTIALIHSGLNDKERLQAWLQAQMGKASIIIGTRSAVFTPIVNLGVIIVDEEHDTSFKQLEGPRYHARDVAIMRAQMNNIPIILGSATPSFETLHNITLGKFYPLNLPQRALNTLATHIKIIDMRNQKLIYGISTPLIQAITNHLEQQQQVLVFVNRRGYAPILICHQCGWQADCKRCDAHLTLHLNQHYLQCHHCDWRQAIPKQCIKCSSSQLIPLGIGTERLEINLRLQFPHAKILRIDRDTTRRKGELKNKLAMINSGEANLLIGTQMLAKGHHFPNLTLVAIIDADQGFFSQDFRATERLGQLILQVAGRAGRADKAGTVMVQTHVPNHPLLNTLIQKGYNSFAELIINERKQAKLPPFYHLALLSCQAKSEDHAKNFLQNIKDLLTRIDTNRQIQLLGPAAAPLVKKSGFYRMQLLLVSPQRKFISQALHQLRTQKIPLRNCKLSIDIDPIDLS